MPILQQEVIELGSRFHETVMIKKGTASEQAAFFLYPNPMIILLQGEDISMQKNYEIHQKLTDEIHIPQDNWFVTPLCNNPEKVRAVGCVYWEGRLVDEDERAPRVKCYVGEDWIIQRTETGELKFASYINTYHYFLADSRLIDL